MTHKSWLSGAAILRRNYADLTFCPRDDAADMARSKQRTLLRLGSELARFKVFHSGTPDAQAAPYADAGLLPAEFDKLTEAAFLADDAQDLFIGINAEEHVVIRARGAPEGLEALTKAVRSMEETLRDPHHPFAWHDQFGYLSYRPQLSGSGLTLSLLLHLPMLSFIKQNRGQDSGPDEFGCELKPFGGNPAFNPSRLFVLANASSQGMDDQQIQDAVRASGEALDSKEESLRQKAFSTPRAAAVLDQAWRSYGILKYARKLIPSDFLTHWSSLRVGCASGVLPLTLEKADSLLPLSMNGSFIAQGEDPGAIPFRRADAVRRVLSGG